MFEISTLESTLWQAQTTVAAAIIAHDLTS